MEFSVFEYYNVNGYPNDKYLPELTAESFKAAKEHAKEHANESGVRTYVMDEDDDVLFIAKPGNDVYDFSEGKYDADNS